MRTSVTRISELARMRDGTGHGLWLWLRLELWLGNRRKLYMAYE